LVTSEFAPRGDPCFSLFSVVAFLIANEITSLVGNVFPSFVLAIEIIHQTLL